MRITDGSTFKTKNMLDQIFLEVTERYNISDDVIKAFQTGEMPQNLSEEEETRFAYELQLLNSEMMALGSEYVLGSEEMINRLVESERGTARKMLRRIKDRIALIENAFKGDKSANAALKELRKAEKLFSDALAASGEKYLRRAYVERREEKENTIQYSLMNDRSYADNVQAIIEMSDEAARQNIEENIFVSIASDTPSVILENVEGAENLEIIIPFRKLYAAIKQNGVVNEHYHNLGELAYQLPKYIGDPDAIVTLPNGRINLFTTIKTKKGNNGVVSVELNSVKDINSKNKKYNVVVTFFSADDNYLQNTIAKATSVNYQKENLSQVNPQLLKWMGTINERSSFDSISENRENVNIKQKKGSDDTQYSLRDLDDGKGGIYNYTKEQYERFGWVRANDVLSAKVWEDFTEKFAKAKNGGSYPKSASGEWIIAAGDKDKMIDKYLVYAKGEIESPEITRIVEIDLDNETDLDERRRELYACERRGIQQEAGDIFRRYTPSDYGYNEYTSNLQESKSHYSGDGQQRGRSGAQAQRVTGYHFNEDGSTRVTYADGSEEVQFSRRYTTPKHYTQEEVAQIINGIQSNLLQVEEGTVTISSKKKLQDLLWNLMNTTEEGKGDQIKVATRVAEFRVISYCQGPKMKRKTNLDLEMPGLTKNKGKPTR